MKNFLKLKKQHNLNKKTYNKYHSISIKMQVKQS